MKHIIIYLAIALVMFGLLGWYFAQQEDLQPKALQAELSVSNVAKLPQQKVEMLFSDMSNEEKNSFRIAIQNELGAAMDVAAHDLYGQCGGADDLCQKSTGAGLHGTDAGAGE